MSTNKERLIAALQEPLETTLTRYKTHLDGLKEDQVEENRDLYGENVITKGQEDSIIKKIYESIINPFTVILLVIALVSFITNVWLAKPGEEDPTTSIIIVTLVLISGGIRFIQELRSDKAASNLSRMIVNTATVLRDGSEQEIPIDEIVVGDVVKLSAGDMIPADVVLLDSRDFFVQQSGLTGESDAVEKACLAKADGQNLESLLESESLAFMGTNVISGRATALVLVVGDDTMMGAIEQTINTYDEPTSFEREMNSISWLLIRLMLVMVPVVFVINGLTDGDWLEAGGDGVEEGLLGPHRLLLPSGAHGPGVDAVGEVVQVAPGGLAQDLDQEAHIGGGQGAHVVDPPAGQGPGALVPHPPQGPHGQDVEEVPGGGGRDEQEAVRLGVGGGELGDEFGGGDAHGGGQAEPGPQFASDPSADAHGRAQAPSGAGHVEEGLVDADPLQHGRDLAQDLHDPSGDPGVDVVAHGQDDGVGAQPLGLGHGHGRAHPAGAGLVGGGRNDAAPVLAAHDDGAARQVGALQQFDGGEEGVHVDVEDVGAGVVLAPGAAGGGGSGRSAHGGSPFSAVSAVRAPQASLSP